MEKLTFEQLPDAVTQLYQKLTSIETILLSRSDQQSEADQILSVQKAAELINLTVPTVYGLVQRSAIPVSKQGKRLYFSKFELIDWIKEGRKKTAAEISREASSFINKRNKGGRK